MPRRVVQPQTSGISSGNLRHPFSQLILHLQACLKRQLFLKFAQTILKSSISQIQHFSNLAILKFNNSQMEQFSNRAFLKWSNSQMEQFSNGAILKWSDSQMEQFSNGAILKWSDSQMEQFSNGAILKWSDLGSPPYAIFQDPKNREIWHAMC